MTLRRVGEESNSATIAIEEATTILTELVALRSVNPMGCAYTGETPVERQVIERIEALFQPYGVEMRRQRCSPIHENLLVMIPGKSPGPFTLFESHVDTVPADDWADRAFTPRVQNGVLFGRGACDDKGPLTAMILAALDILRSGMLPPGPIILMAAGDEEYGQSGIKQFAAEQLPLKRAVVGEATDLVPVVQHNGTVRWDITVHGRSAHTSRPELGRNAILGAMQVIRSLEKHQQLLRAARSNPRILGPTLTVTMIKGGRTRNAVPDVCTMAVDFRILPGMDPTRAREDVIAALASIPHEISHSETQLVTPPLSTSPDDPFCLATLDICRRITKRAGLDVAGAPWGTDAAWVADCAPAIVLGPGTTDTAHAIDENIRIEEVVAGALVYREIMLSEV